MRQQKLSRRRALASVASTLAAAPLAGQDTRLAHQPAGPMPPLAELVNVFEMEDIASRQLPASTYSLIAGGDRSYFDRITFRPRMMVNTSHLDLTQELFGQPMFAPILLGPTSHQQQFHPDGELALVRGAAAVKTAVVVSCDSSFPIEKIAAEAKTPLWYQVFPESDVEALASRARRAVDAGCKVVCLTVGAPYHDNAKTKAWALPKPSSATVTWSMIDRLREKLGVPLVLKGIMRPQEAEAAAKQGVHGIVVSNYGALRTQGVASPMEMLPPIAEAVRGRIPVLIDGGVRRGTDIMKALAFGAQAVLVARPPLWGLAAYGADGVETVLEMLQTELASTMCMCGKANLKAVDRSVVKVHAA